MKGPLGICVDARVGDGTAGGVQQFVLGLASGLASLDDGDERYVFLADERSARWLPEHLGERMSLAVLPSGEAPGRRAGRLRSVARRVKARAREWPLLRRARLPPVALSRGRLEALGVNLVHFTMQEAMLTGLPSIYHPHDLQHVHLPGNFSPRTRIIRDRDYRVFSSEAAMVAVSSSWAREDVIRAYGLPADKVVVVPLAPPTEAYGEPSVAEQDEIARRLALPARFLLYPAQTWPHKNHLGLIEAIKVVERTTGEPVPLVCSGHRNRHFERISRRVRELGLEEHVRFVGFVSPAELQTLYRRCTAVVIPTCFEAASFPLWEAFLAGAPVACSNVTSLPRQSAGAALLFDPLAPERIAEAIVRLWSDDALRRELVRKGRENVARFTWKRTARTFRALYRVIGGGTVGDEDRALLSARPPI